MPVKSSGLFVKSLALVGMRVLASACALVLTLLIARRSVHELGVFRTLFAYFMMCESLPLLGMQTYLIREISVQPGRAKRYSLHALVFSLIVALAGMLSLCGIALFGGYSPQVHEGLFFVAAGFPAMSASLLMFSILVSNGQAERYGFINVVETLVRTVIGGIFILAGWGVLPAIAAMVISRWLVLLLYWRLIKPLIATESWCWDGAFFREFLGYVPTFAGINAMATILRFAPQVMLPWMLNDAGAGQFAAAYMFIDLILLVPIAFVLNVGPVFARKAHESMAALADSCRQAIKIMTLAVAPMAAILTAIARPMFSALFPRNPAYAVSAEVLQIIIWVCCLQVVDLVLSVTIVARGKQNIDFQTLSIGASTLVLFLAILIPIKGVIGAGMALVLGMAVQVTARFALVGRQIDGIKPYELLWRPGAAALITLAVAIPAGRYHWIFGAIAGVLAYLAALAGLGVFSRHEREDVIRFLQAEKL